MIVKRRSTIKKNKKSKQLKTKKSKQLKNKKPIKRLKKKYTRQIYYAGADSPGDFKWPRMPINSIYLLNVNNDDPRLLDFMENPTTIIEPNITNVNIETPTLVTLERSPNLTHVPYINMPDKVQLTIGDCSSLVSIDYRNLKNITFGRMNISNDMLKQKLHVDALLEDYCCNFRFYHCTFDEDCEIKFISTNRNKILSFTNCIGIPRYPFDSIDTLSIYDCQNVSFPYFNQSNVLTSINIKNNQYINNDARRRLTNYLSNFYNVIFRVVRVDTDLPINRNLSGDGPRDFEVLSTNNGWDPPRPIWGTFVPNSEHCDITMDTLLIDFLNGDATLRDYINENAMDPNTVFLKCNRDYIVLDLTRVQNEINKYGIDNSVIVYECIAVGGLKDSNTILNKPLFKLGEYTGSTRYYTPLNQIQHIINHSEHKFWECYNSGIKINSVVSHSIKSGATRVCGSHCQDGQDGELFHIRKLIVSDEVDEFVSPNNHVNR